MKKTLLSTFLITLLFYTTGFAQTTTNDNLEFSTGYNIGALKNLEFAPVSRYDYQSLLYMLKYERYTKNQNLFEVQLDYLNTEIVSDVIPVLNSAYSKIGLRFSYLKEVLDQDKFSIYAGLQTKSAIALYGNNNVDIIADQSVGLGSQFSYQINNKQALFSKLSVPVVLFRVTDTDAGIYSFNRYQSISWNIGYKHELSNRLDLTFRYDFNYDRLQIPSAFREIQYQFNLGLNFKF